MPVRYKGFSFKKSRSNLSGKYEKTKLKCGDSLRNNRLNGC